MLKSGNCIHLNLIDFDFSDPWFYHFSSLVSDSGRWRFTVSSYLLQCMCTVQSLVTLCKCSLKVVCPVCNLKIVQYLHDISN